MFNDRTDAGRRLAQKLQSHKVDNAVVLALPRGGVVVGAVIAREFSLPLDIIAVRKIGHPANPEYAIGAVDENGAILIEEAERRAVNKEWLQKETDRQRLEARRRSVVYRAGRTPSTLAGKVVLLVDDGIATGLTMRLAVRSVKVQKPKKIIVAVPVAPTESVRALKREGADEVVVLEPPEDFMGAVGAHYAVFEQVEDDEVIRLMQSAYGERNTHTS